MSLNSVSNFHGTLYRVQTPKKLAALIHRNRLSFPPSSNLPSIPNHAYIVVHLVFFGDILLPYYITHRSLFAGSRAVEKHCHIYLRGYWRLELSMSYPDAPLCSGRTWMCAPRGHCWCWLSDLALGDGHVVGISTGSGSKERPGCARKLGGEAGLEA